MATAPAHVEDRLHDAWLEFAEEQPGSHTEQTDELQTADASMASAVGVGGSQLAPAPKSELHELKSKKQKKRLKVAMEAMIRGIELFANDTEADADAKSSHNIAAWHNVPHPYVKFYLDLFLIFYKHYSENNIHQTRAHYLVCDMTVIFYCFTRISFLCCSRFMCGCLRLSLFCVSNCILNT